jgi:hypothetical protein
MAEQPILLFPRPSTADRTRKNPFPGGSLNLPDHKRQVRRLRPQFKQLLEVFAAERAQLQSAPEGADPEKVLVLELAGSVDGFLSAIRRIEGLEWLADFDENDIPPDSDFFNEGDEALERPIGGQLYLVMSNHRAAEELESLWRRWAADRDYDFPYGQRSLRHVFAQLRTLRFWGVKDRLRGTGVLERWNELREHDRDPIPFEVELWFRSTESAQAQASEHLAGLIAAEGGTIHGGALIPQIRYHALVGSLPRARVETILEADEPQFVTADEIMFVRPTGQMDVPGTLVAEISEEALSALPEPDAPGVPIVALFDGMPLQNHRRLAGRLVVDDPDGFEGQYQARERQHGTAMASLLLHGDIIAGEEPCARPIYVRPVLTPDPNAWVTPRPECAPPHTSFPDLIRRAVLRMLGEDQGTPAAPEVEIVNFSIGDRTRPFEGRTSPLARVLDWLSLEYGVLFVVSAGNQDAPFTLEIPSDEFASAPDEHLQREVLRSSFRSALFRRLLSPAESINALTVGRTHSDLAGPGPFPSGRDPYVVRGLPACTSAIGPGFRRSVKPEVLVEGGRQLVAVDSTQEPDRTIVVPHLGPQPPGQQVAAPGPAPGILNGVAFGRGTSNAAALTTRALARARDDFAARLEELAVERPARRTWVAVLKALAAHGAGWGEEADVLADALALAGRDIRSSTARLLGYGSTDIRRALACNDQRVTLVGWGELADDEGHEYIFPLPPSLSGVSVARQLTLTLAWLSPIVPGRKNYRAASLWVSPPTDELQLRRVGPDWQQVQRGTLQHEILRSDKAVVVSPGAMMSVKVNCRSDAGPLREQVPYGLFVTLEVAETLDLPIYAEVAQVIQPLVRVQPPSDSG